MKHGHGNKIKQKTEARAILLKPFTVYSLCKQKFVVCLFVDKETNRSYPFCKQTKGTKRTKLTKRTKQTCPSMFLPDVQLSLFVNKLVELKWLGKSYLGEGELAQKERLKGDLHENYIGFPVLAECP
jgi:hypothetical protein